MHKMLYFLFIIVSIISSTRILKINQLVDSKILIKEEVIFTLKSGTGQLALGEQLYQAKVINHPYAFYWRLRLKPELSNFKAGTYRFIPGMSLYELLVLLKKGKEAQFSLRFIEGMRLSDYLKQLIKAPYIQHTLNDSSYITVARALNLNLRYPEQLEGWFWPDTWLYTAHTTDIDILKRAHNKMVALVEKVWKDREKGLPYKNQNQLITMASILEKETACTNERYKIASVFINRLRADMRLQTDPTVIYGMGNNYNGKVSKQDVKIFTSYNTYMIHGLPPGPIATPSWSSLDAAAHPAKTSYLYFVANGKGGHIFNTDLAGHNQSVQNYLRTIKKKNA